MNKKKGFTLIELLAIIVILAIIAVITVPLILNIINDAQKNASIDSAYGYKDALEKYYITKTVKNTEYELPNGYKNISELPEDFIVSGESPSEGWVKLKKGIVDRFSLKYKDYVVTMDNDKNVTSEKQENVDPHVIGDYQEVEYLESTGTQYIDTGAKLFNSSNHEIKIDFEPIEFYNYVTLWGTGYDADTFESWIYSTGKLAARYNNVRYGTDTLLELNKKYKAKYVKNDNNLFFYIDNSLVQSPPTVSDRIVDSSFYLFKSGNDFGRVKLYNAELYSGDTLVRNFVPVIRKSDNKPGMLDLANRTNNLFNPYAVIKGRQDNGVVGYENGTSDLYVSNNTIYLTTNTTWRGFTSDFIEVSSRDYHINVPPQSGISVGCSQYDANKQFIKKTTLNTQLEENCKYIRFTITFENAGEYQVSNIMLNEGTEALPYEPYGYKFYTNAGTDEFITGPEI